MAEKSLVEALSGIFQKYGISENDEAKALLEKKEIKEATISEELYGALGQEMITLETAKHHREIADHFKGKYFQTLEGNMEKGLKNLGASEEVLAEFKKKDITTTTKMDNALKLFKESMASNPNATEAEIKKKYEKYVEQVNNIPTLLLEKENEFKQKETALISSFEKERMDNEFSRQLGSYQFSEAFEREEVEFLVKKKLESLPFTFKRGEKGIEVYQKDAPELLATKDNKPLTLKGILDEQVSKYVKKGEGTSGHANGSGQQKKVGEENNQQVSSGHKYGDNTAKLAADREKMNKILGK